METILQLYAVGTNVLHRRCAHRSRDQRHVLQPAPALLQRPHHQVVPAHPSASLHDAVLLPYAARHPQFFGLGSDAAQIGTQVQALQPQVQDVLYGELEEMFSSRGSAEVYLFTLNAARGLDAVLRQ